MHLLEKLEHTAHGTTSNYIARDVEMMMIESCLVTGVQLGLHN